MSGEVIMTAAVAVPYLTGRALYWPVALISSLFFLWGFSYGLLDVLNKHFQVVLGLTLLESTALQVAYFGVYFFYSPIAAVYLKRHGYKKSILMGLSFYSIGALLFWPCTQLSTEINPTLVFAGFVICTLIIACGLAALETAANSYVMVIGPPETAASRLQFCQSWNGLASFTGPLIASKYFFSDGHQTSLDSVRFVYLAVAFAGFIVRIVFSCAKLPEVDEKALEVSQHEVSSETSKQAMGTFWEQYNTIFAFLAQFCYVGAQVSIASFFLNYATDNANLSSAYASNLLSYSLIIFTISRFAASAILKWMAPDLLLAICAGLNILTCAFAAGLHGTQGVSMIIIGYAFESIQYPIIFILGTENLGQHTQRAAGLLVQGVAGGATFPPIQGAVADAYSTRISYVVPMFGFIYVFGYGMYHWIVKSRCVFRPRPFEFENPEEDPMSPDREALIDKSSHWVTKKVM